MVWTRSRDRSVQVLDVDISTLTFASMCIVIILQENMRLISYATMYMKLSNLNQV